jgi:hypothetical protein
MDAWHWPRCSRGANLRGDDEAKPTTLQHTCRCVCFSSRGGALVRWLRPREASAQPNDSKEESGGEHGSCRRGRSDQVGKAGHVKNDDRSDWSMTKQAWGQAIFR